MKLILFLLIFLAVSSKGLLLGQVNYIEYHKEILGAEENFLNTKYMASLSDYKRIFNKYPKLFLRDAFIAAEIACLAKEKPAALYFLEKCFQKGLNIKALKFVPVINNFLCADSTSINQVKTIYRKSRPVYLSSVNFLLRARISAMLAKDDLNKSSPAAWRSSKISDSIYVKDMVENACEFVDIVHEFGFPGQTMLGVVDPDLYNDYCDDSYYLNLGSSFDLIILHYSYLFQILKQECLDAVRAGELHPRIYTLMYEWSYFDKMYTKYSWKYPYIDKNIKLLDSMYLRYNVYIDPLYYSKNTLFVNSCRSKIGMASLQHDRAMTEFAKSQNIKLNFSRFQLY